MTIQALGHLLTASEDDLTARYRLLPYGEPGSTNKGKVTVTAGVLDIDGGPFAVNLEHEYKRPAGTMVAEEADDGLDAVVSYANTTAGRDAFEEARAGLRAGISVEIDNPVIRAGKLIAGKLAGAGLVVKPAFPSAQLTAAADLDESEDDGQTPPSTDKKEENTVPQKKTEPPKINAEDSLINKLAASLNKQQAKDKEAEQLHANENAVTLDTFTNALFGMDTITNPSLKAAAFDTITQADMFDPTSVPQYLGELARARDYRPIFSPLFAPDTLTGMRIEGWHIEKKPTVDTWDPPYSGTAPAETMNDIPTNEVTFAKKDYTAKRIAGGHRFDRIHVDFPNPAAMSAFIREEDLAIAERLDQIVKAQFLSMAVTKEATGTDATDAWTKLVFGIAHALKFGIPSYSVIGNDLWREMKNTAKIDAREFLAAELGLESGTLDGFRVVPADIDDTTMNGRLFVGNTNAAKLYTPPGNVTRVDAQELQKGALDKAVFGYYALVPHYEATAKNGIVEVTQAA